MAGQDSQLWWDGELGRWEEGGREGRAAGGREKIRREPVETIRSQSVGFLCCLRISQKLLSNIILEDKQRKRE